MTTNYTEPYYLYDLKMLKNTLTQIINHAQDNMINLKYAIKANNNPILLHIIKSYTGADCVSIWEIKHALNYFHASDIVFAGSGKTINEIKEALMLNIGIIHCESMKEYLYIKKYKKELNSITEIALRLNPDFKVDTHEKISTGEKNHKFGMPLEDIKKILEIDKSIIGIHCHIGSQILDLSYFENYSNHIRNLLDELDYVPKYLNLGGGLGIDYDDPEKMPNFKGWLEAIRKHLPPEFIKVITLEPGRSIVGQCGKLIGQVQYIKNDIAILDIGMSQIMRPALYNSYHKITTDNNNNIKKYKVCGPSCESTDVFGNYELDLNIQDIVTVHSCGAYVESMSLNYNMKPKCNYKLK